MSKFATGKNSYAISDRSGFRYRYKDMRKEWTGAFVGRDEYEPKQPQLGPFRKVIDAQALKDARPDRTEPKSEVLLQYNSFSSVSGGNTVTVYEPGHGRVSGDVVCFRKTSGFAGITSANLNKSTGYSITKIDENSYTFEVDGDAALETRSGGGDFSSAGPVTVEN
jgi:hypothetical protein